MKIDVIMTPGETTVAGLAGRTVVVIDILRASSTIVQALSVKAKAVFPVASIEEALRLANSFGRDEVLLAGERRCVPIEGFDLGNSPREYTAERVGGKTLVMTTTNGTAAMALTLNAERVYIGSLLNFTAIVDELVRLQVDPVFLCAGREKHFSLEDAACAGEFAIAMKQARPGEWQLNDGAKAAIALATNFGTGIELFSTAIGGRSIVDAGLEEDLAFCAQRDLHDLLPVLHDRSITLHSPSPAPLTP